MKAYAVTVTFLDGEKEGVIFTRKQDAMNAINGCENGSVLAVTWAEIYSDTECEVNFKEIDI